MDIAPGQSQNLTHAQRTGKGKVHCHIEFAVRTLVQSGADHIGGPDVPLLVFHFGQQCEYLAQGFYKAGVKGVVLPAGGHAVYINMDEFFDGKRDHTTFAGTGFSLELIRRYGIRVSELGDFSMEYDLKTPEQQAELANVVRFAIDRSRLTQEHLDYVIAAVKALYEDRESIPNMRIVWGHKLPMRHFHAFLEPYANEEK